MAARLDHVVVLVDDLDRATDRYEGFGFTVTPGGVHTGGLTHNAVIPFEDGTYLELLGFTWATAYEELSEAFKSGSLKALLDGRTPLDRRFLPLGARGPGLADCAIACDSIASVVRELRGLDVSIEGPVPGSRIKPDGSRISWNLGLPAHPGLPFLIRDETARELRVPRVGTDHHGNGVSGISQVVYSADSGNAKRFKYLARSVGAKVDENSQGLNLELRAGRILVQESASGSALPVDVRYTVADGTSISHLSL